jgi:hypothetical protein
LLRRNARKLNLFGFDLPSSSRLATDLLAPDEGTARELLELSLLFKVTRRVRSPVYDLARLLSWTGEFGPPDAGVELPLEVVTGGGSEAGRPGDSPAWRPEALSCLAWRDRRKSALGDAICPLLGTPLEN